MSLALFDPIDANRQQPFKAISIELRERLPWLWRPGFAIARTEGYKPGFFGCRAGMPDNLDVYNVLHEISHAIEMVKSEPTMWKRRLGQDNFGLRIKSYQTVAGQRYHEPITMQATQRECRVGAIQLHLLQAGGYNSDNFKTDFVTVLKYMADSYFGGDCILNTYDPEKYTTKQKKWVNVRTKIIEQEYKKYTQESIQLVWTGVTDFLAKKDFDLDSRIEATSPTPA